MDGILYIDIDLIFWFLQVFDRRNNKIHYWNYLEYSKLGDLR